MRYRAVLTVIGPVDPRRPWLSTASTRRLWRPGRSNPGFRLSAYGDVVSEPRGTPSSRNVTATMRPESDMASAFNVAGRKMRPVGPRKRTLSGSETAAEGRDTAAASNAKAIAAHRFPRNTLEEDCLAADALRRSRLLIALIIVPVTLAVLFISLALPKTYRATSKIVLEGTTDSVSGTDAQSVQRHLATIQVLLTTREMLRSAAKHGLKGETEDTLDDKVHATVDQNANVVSIVATDDSARGAAAIANTVAATFLAKQSRLERQRVSRARATLQRALADLRGTASPQTQTEVASEIAAVRQRLTDLNVSAASSGSELQLAEAAEPPTAPSSPQPVRNSIFGFFAGAFIAALVVLARAQLRPRVSGARELSRLLDVPVLVEVPFVRRRFGHSPKTLSAVEYEAYQTLQASLRMQLPPEGQQIVLVTSALHGEGKTEVTAALGLVLAQAGQRTWLVSADMRWPRLHELFDVAQTPGLAEVLAGARKGGDNAELVGARKGARSREPASGRLHVLASGHRPPDPAQLLAGNALDSFFEEIKASDYDYVLLDGPPLLGLVDSQVLAQRVDGVLLVCRPDRLTSENAIDMRELLERLRVKALGLVTIGARGSPTSYFEA